MTDIPSHNETIVSPNRPRSTLEGVGSTKHFPSRTDSLLSLPDHATDWSGQHVLTESREEGLFDQILVVLVENLGSGHAEFHGGQLVALGLEALNNLTDQAPLDAIWFDLYSIVE